MQNSPNNSILSKYWVTNFFGWYYTPDFARELAEKLTFKQVTTEVAAEAPQGSVLPEVKSKKKKDADTPPRTADELVRKMQSKGLGAWIIALDAAYGELRDSEINHTAGNAAPVPTSSATTSAAGPQHSADSKQTWNLPDLLSAATEFDPQPANAPNTWVDRLESIKEVDKSWDNEGASTKTGSGVIGDGGLAPSPGFVAVMKAYQALMVKTVKVEGEEDKKDLCSRDEKQGDLALIKQYAQFAYHRSRAEYMLQSRIGNWAMIPSIFAYGGTILFAIGSTGTSLSGVAEGFGAAAGTSLALLLVSLLLSGLICRGFSALDEKYKGVAPSVTYSVPAIAGVGGILGLWLASNYAADPMINIIGGAAGGALFGLLAIFYGISLARQYRSAEKVLSSTGYALNERNGVHSWMGSDTAKLMIALIGGAVIGALVANYAPMASSALIEATGMCVDAPYDGMITFSIAASAAVIAGHLLGILCSGASAAINNCKDSTKPVERVP